MNPVISPWCFHGFPWPHGVSRKAILRAQLTPMILGGDHAIAAPVCAALAVLQKPLAAWWNWGHLGPVPGAWWFLVVLGSPKMVIYGENDGKLIGKFSFFLKGEHSVPIIFRHIHLNDLPGNIVYRNIMKYLKRLWKVCSNHFCVQSASMTMPPVKRKW